MLLDIMLLEERIVLDGAAVDTIVDQADQPQVPTADHSSAQANNAQASGDQSDPNDATGPVRVLAVSSGVENAETLAAAALLDVITVCYDGSGDSPQDVYAQIQYALNGRQADSIAFANHMVGEGAFAFTAGANVSAIDLAVNSDLQDFWTDVGDLLTDEGRIDLLACDLTDSAAGQLVADNIEALSGHEVAASDDLTGADEAGGDWLLERGGIDIEAIYFNSSQLDDFNGVLAVTDGALDASFDSDGLLYGVPNGVSRCDAMDLYVLNDGKILVSGEATNPKGNWVARYNADGSLDNTFGDGADGSTYIQFSGANPNMGGYIDVDSNGNIVLAGYVDTGANYDMTVAYLNASGILQNSFDTDGKLVLDLGANDYARDVAFDNNDKIVIAGDTDADACLVRLNADGSRDNTFGAAGVYGSNFAGTDKFHALDFDASNRIIAAGEKDGNALVARFTTAGVLDGGFGTGGISTTDLGSGSDRAESLAFQGDGKIVLAGQAGGDFAVARLNADGSADNSFGADSNTCYVITDFGNGEDDSARSVAIQADGKIVVSGEVYIDMLTTNAGIARYWSDGALDTSFDGDGLATVDFGCGIWVSSNAVSVLSDGTIMQAGKADPDGTANFGISKHQNANPSTKASTGNINYNPDAAPVAVDDAILVGDAQNSLNGATVRISSNFNAGDTLNFVNQNGITHSYDANTGVLTLSGTTTVANYQIALQSITFNTNAINAQTRTVSFVLTDPDGNTSTAATRNVAVPDQNDAPTATNTTKTVNYNEGDASVALDDINVTDPDAGEQITATLTLADTATGALTANDGATYTAGTGKWTITDTVANVNAALANVAFIPTSTNTTDTTIAVNIADGGEDGAQAATGTITLGVTPKPGPQAVENNDNGENSGGQTEPTVITDNAKADQSPSDNTPGDSNNDPGANQGAESDITPEGRDVMDSAAGEFDGPGGANADLNQVVNALSGVLDSGPDLYGHAPGVDADLNQVIRALEAAANPISSGFGSAGNPLSVSFGDLVASANTGPVSDAGPATNAGQAMGADPAVDMAQAAEQQPAAGPAQAAGQPATQVATAATMAQAAAQAQSAPQAEAIRAVENSALRSSLTSLNTEVASLRFNALSADFSAKSLEAAVDNLSQLAQQAGSANDARAESVLSSMADELTAMCEQCAEKGEDVGELMEKLAEAKLMLGE